MDQRGLDTGMHRDGRMHTLVYRFRGGVTASTDGNERMFFSEGKAESVLREPKTFASLGPEKRFVRGSKWRNGLKDKRFLVIFFKKEPLT